MKEYGLDQLISDVAIANWRYKSSYKFSCQLVDSVSILSAIFVSLKDALGKLGARIYVFSFPSEGVL